MEIFLHVEIFKQLLVHLKHMTFVLTEAAPAETSSKATTKSSTKLKTTSTTASASDTSNTTTKTTSLETSTVMKTRSNKITDTKVSSCVVLCYIIDIS